MTSDVYTPLWKKLLQLLFLCALLFGALGGLYALFGHMDHEHRAMLFVEIAKSLLQLIFVILLGGLVTTILKYFENTRKADKAMSDFRGRFLERLSSLDDSIMKARRVLRSAGMTRQNIQHQVQVVNQAQITTYDEVVDSFLEVEIGMRRLVQDVRRFRDAFSESPILERKLQDMERFVRALLDEYETMRPRYPNLVFFELAVLRGFTDVPTGQDFQAWKQGYEGASDSVKRDLLPFTFRKAMED